MCTRTVCCHLVKIIKCTYVFTVQSYSPPYVHCTKNEDRILVLYVVFPRNDNIVSEEFAQVRIECICGELVGKCTPDKHIHIFVSAQCYINFDNITIRTDLNDMYSVQCWMHDCNCARTMMYYTGHALHYCCTTTS